METKPIHLPKDITLFLKIFLKRIISTLFKLKYGCSTTVMFLLQLIYFTFYFFLISLRL